MTFVRTVAEALLSGTHNLPLSLFLLSAALLVLGVVLRVWADALNLRFLDNEDISWIERTHPHVPSVRVLVTINLCGLALLAVGLEALRDTFPFNDPYRGLNLCSVFLLAAALGTLGELRWAGARAYAKASILGTALAFLVLSGLSARLSAGAPERAILAASAVLVVVVAWVALGPAERDRRVLGTGAAVFLFWVLISALQ